MTIDGQLQRRTRSGAVVAQTETITITGTNDAPTVGGALSQTATEDAPPGSASTC